MTGSKLARADSSDTKSEISSRGTDFWLRLLLLLVGLRFAGLDYDAPIKYIFRVNKWKLKYFDNGGIWIERFRKYKVEKWNKRIGKKWNHWYEYVNGPAHYLIQIIKFYSFIKIFPKLSHPSSTFQCINQVFHTLISTIFLKSSFLCMAWHYFHSISTILNF